MTLTHSVAFDIALGLSVPEAVAFVRDVRLSLSRARFIENLSLESPTLERGEPTTVSAHLPVNASLFGQQRLVFRSRLHPTPQGARLEAIPLDTDEPGWAEVSGEAQVTPDGEGSRVGYRFDITIHLRLPKAEKWGGRALIRMIEYTAQRVLENITQSFPEAVQAAALEAEAARAA
jgi:hypothetical protein